MKDYVRRAINEGYEAVYFTEREENQEEEDLADDPLTPDVTSDNDASSFQRWYALMHSTRRNARINHEQQRSDADLDD